MQGYRKNNRNGSIQKNKIDTSHFDTSSSHKKLHWVKTGIK